MRSLVLLLAAARAFLPTAAESPADLPTVCITMPTNSRPEFVARALVQIARSDYPRELISEVVIVDDSPETLRVKPRDNEQLPVVYVPLSTQLSVGEKRNIAADRCTADVVAHWDDDDLYGPTRLRAQVEPLARGEAAVTVLEHRFTYFMNSDELFVAATPGGSSWGPHFGTLAWRRDIFSVRGVRFTNTSEAEDYGFAQHAIERANASLAVVSVDPNATGAAMMFACVRHGSNT